jgi:hypothetical protein
MNKIFLFGSVIVTIFFGIVVYLGPKRICTTNEFYVNDVVTHRLTGQRAVVIDVECHNFLIDAGTKPFWTRPQAWTK